MRRGGLRKRLHEPAPGPTSSETPRGGIRQRLDVGHDMGPKPKGIDIKNKPLNKLLMKKWCSGKLTCKDVFEFGSAADEQGCPGIEQLAKADLRNAARKLMSVVGFPAKAPNITFIDVDSKDGGKKLELPILCPIDVLEKMIESDNDRFIKCLRGEDGDIPNFWYNMTGATVYEKNKEHIDEMASMAIKIHADSAPTTKVDGMLTISWSSLHGKGTTKEKKIVFAIIPQSWKACIGQVFCRFAWAMNALCDGFLPQLDWKNRQIAGAGRRLAGGFRLAPIFCVSDWEFYSNYCGFPTGQSQPNMCWLDNASPSEGPLCFCNVSSDAAWRKTFRSHEQYLEECRTKGQAPADLMRIQTLRLEGFLPDAMHGMDSGFTAELVGNIMFEVMETAGWGSTQKQRAAKLDEDLKKHYKTIKESVKIDGRITFERIKSAGEWPCLKAKAAATRHLVPYIVGLAERFNSGSNHDQRRLLVCKCLDRAYSVMKNANRFLTGGEKAELKELSQVMMSCYRNLSMESLQNGVRTYKMKPKLHETQHILEDAVINPMHVWLYSDEDLQRCIKEIAVQCHPITVPYMCLFRWIVQTFGEFDD